MQYLVALALFACAANAASVFQPWQQGTQSVASASASVGGQVAQPFAKSFIAQPAVAVAKAVAQPAVQTYEAVRPVAAVKNANVKDAEAGIVRSESDVSPVGFNFVYETDNGIAAQEQGSLKKVNEVESVVVRGSYQYVGPDGVPVSVTYIADENGFQPQGDSLPTPPPVPVAILRSLEWIASQPKYEDPINVKKF